MEEDFFSTVPGERVRQGIWAGIVAAAATAGALVGFGRAHGAWLRPLNAVGHMVYGTRALVMTGFDPGVTLAALALHLVSIIILAVIFTWLAGRLRGRPLLAAAFLYAAVVFLVDHFVVPPRLAPGFERALSAPEVGAIYVVLALALALGVRLAAPAAR